MPQEDEVPFAKLMLTPVTTISFASGERLLPKPLDPAECEASRLECSVVSGMVYLFLYRTKGVGTATLCLLEFLHVLAPAAAEQHRGLCAAASVGAQDAACCAPPPCCAGAKPATRAGKTAR